MLNCCCAVDVQWSHAHIHCRHDVSIFYSIRNSQIKICTIWPTIVKKKCTIRPCLTMIFIHYLIHIWSKLCMILFESFGPLFQVDNIWSNPFFKGSFWLLSDFCLTIIWSTIYPISNNALTTSLVICGYLTTRPPARLSTHVHAASARLHACTIWTVTPARFWVLLRTWNLKQKKEAFSKWWFFF